MNILTSLQDALRWSKGEIPLQVSTYRGGVLVHRGRRYNKDAITTNVGGRSDEENKGMETSSDKEGGGK